MPGITKPGQSEADDVEKHTLAELNYTGASTFLRSALSRWSEAGGCLLLLGHGGRAGQGREGRQVPSDKVEPGWRDSMDKTEQCVLLFQTSSEFR